MTEVKSAAEFHKTVESSGDRLIVVDFFATWCPPCRAIAPFIHQLQGQYPGVTFLKVDVDKIPEIAQEHRVRAMPTFTFLKNGATMYRFEGAMQDALVYWIDELKDRKNVTPADLAALVEKAPQMSLGSLLKRSASALLLPVAIIVLVLLWSGLYVFTKLQTDS